MFNSRSSKRIVIVAPHPDDETLGAGGTAAKLVANGHWVSVIIVSGHLPPLYPDGVFERTVAEARAALAVLGLPEPSLLRIPATYLGDVSVHDLNKQVGDAIFAAEPHVVLFPYPDRHIDHRIIFDSVMVACRPVGRGASVELLAVYETLSETHWNAPHIEPNFAPNWIVDIGTVAERKWAALESYQSQIPAWPGARSVKAAEALARFRGSQAGFAYGEAFQVVRMRS